ncbi:hypothetical protein K440DRAFT_200847 [Wilcoxina mikolae CBS 423.85]|nr:hypothetical protein K440DRAFT_200847 [Wilcoxina mikolae CBS 423.85]
MIFAARILSMRTAIHRSHESGESTLNIYKHIHENFSFPMRRWVIDMLGQAKGSQQGEQSRPTVLWIHCTGEGARLVSRSGRGSWRSRFTPQIFARRRSKRLPIQQAKRQLSRIQAQVGGAAQQFGRGRSVANPLDTNLFTMNTANAARTVLPFGPYRAATPVSTSISPTPSRTRLPLTERQITHYSNSKFCYTLRYLLGRSIHLPRNHCHLSLSVDKFSSTMDQEFTDERAAPANCAWKPGDTRFP